MYPSSLSRRAISTLSFEAGIDVVSCSALLALRMRVSMSATGSVSTVVLLPRALRHAGDDALVGELPQADAAEPELLVDGARPPAAVAAAVLARRVLLRPGGLDHEGLLRHLRIPLCGRRCRTGSRAPAAARGRPRRSARSS